MQQDVDSSAIYLIKIALANLTGNFLEDNFYRFENKDSNRQLKDSLTSEIISSYANKYITHLYVFDNSNLPLNNDDSTSYDIINSIVENKSMPTGTGNLWYYKTTGGIYNYIFRRQVYNDSQFLGSLFVLMQSKSLKNNALVPELFKQVNDVTTQVDKGYAFGVYNKRRLVSSLAGFNFADSVASNQIPHLKYYYLDSLGYSQLWFNAGNDKLIIIAKKNNLLFNFVTLFAYLFVLFIVLAFIVHESKRALEEPVQKFSLRKLFQFNIRTQIQTTIIGLSIFSFLIIGIATISFFIYRFNKNTTTQLINSSQIIANELKLALNADVTTEEDFEKRVTDIAAAHNTDINFYDKSGSLVVSSQPYIYTKEVLSNKINPDAFYEMHFRHSTRFVHTETIGNFSYQSIYMPVKDENDETIAYLNVPLLSSHTELQEEISDFLITVIILNALIFIFAGAIAVMLTGRITSSLELIGNKMKEINIGSTNEEITWNTHDEIGTLVEEYNKMVKKLEQSAVALARSEREGAWQQMARQVAHEIKNPLTPMKLSIQYLQRAMESNTANAVKLSKKLASSLIEQIDQLSKIASDFSQFANIEHINPERFDITEVIKSLVNIYRTGTHTKIKYANDSNKAEIYYDKAQINRLFTNLIKNATEAAKESESIEIFIKQFIVDNHIIISVKDNGNGIKEELQSKIFDPNFTTKTSGTGLGLAICKAIVEKANGKIWFVTAPDEGTIFFVELPLA
jgi:signal transduction histidine kinase